MISIFYETLFENQHLFSDKFRKTKQSLDTMLAEEQAVA